MLKAVQAVQAVMDKKWIPEELTSVTFFGENDWWFFFPLIDARTCERCQEFGERREFSGADLRSTFPNLEIENANRIWANVHPNCRCFLIRIFEKEE